MHYETTNIIVKANQQWLQDYCDYHTKLAKLFKNSIIFRLRQLYFARIKNFENLSENEQQVLDEFKLTEDKFKPISNKYYVPSYEHFVYLFTVTKNPDYYNDLPQQSSQHIIKETLTDVKSYFSAKKDYKANPSKYKGEPKFPKYIKKENTSFDITNQDAVIKLENGKNVLKLPKTKERISLGDLEIQRLKEITIKPFYDTFKISLVFEVEDTIQTREKNQSKEEINDSIANERVLSIDLGVDNIITTSNNCGLVPFIVKGNDLKAFNQWYNKKVAYLKSHLPKDTYTSKQLQTLHKHRHLKINDMYNKIASYIIQYCLKENIGVIVIGKNTYWKQETNMGTKTNQNFCFISHTYLVNKIVSMAKTVGIETIQQEESFTSKASFLDGDNIPIFDKNNDTTYKFSGKRIYRGLYKSKNGILMNADVNGASNILKKAIPNAFDHIKDFSYLYKTTNVVEIKNGKVQLKEKEIKSKI